MTEITQLARPVYQCAAVTASTLLVSVRPLVRSNTGPDGICGFFLLSSVVIKNDYLGNLVDFNFFFARNVIDDIYLLAGSLAELFLSESNFLHIVPSHL